MGAILVLLWFSAVFVKGISIEASKNKPAKVSFRQV